MSLEGQPARRRRLVEKVCRHAMQLYREDGSFEGPYGQPDERDRYRLAAILAEHGGPAEIALANTLVRNSFGGPAHDYTTLPLEENFKAGDAKMGAPRDWNIFQSNIATILVAHHGDRLAPDVRAKLLRIAKRNVSRYAGSAQPDYFFHGANDNMPAHATSGLIVAGQMLGDPQAIGDGVYRLQLFAELLSRRGLCSEYASGTYLPLTIGALAEIVELAEDEQVRQLALQIEHQLWADIVGHYHPGSGKAAGGQTRAYTVNTIGHLDCIMTLLWMVTGEPSFCNPERDLITLQPKQVTHFNGDPFKTACGVVYCMLSTFHFPEHLAPLLTRRPYPYSLFASAEQMHSAPDVGGRDAHSTVFQQADWSLASSDHGFMTGNQSEKLRIAYRKVAAPASFKETGVMLFRYLYNDELPGDGEHGLIADHSLARTLQRDELALLVTRGENHNLPLPAKFTRLRFCAILPAHFHEPEEVWVGDRQVRSFTGGSATAEPVFLHLGRAYVAILPLTMTDHGRPCLIRLEKAGDYRLVSFLNYEGAPREFSEQLLQETFNGCFVLMGGPDQDGSFEAFRQSFEISFLEDWWLANNRRTRVVCRGHELLLNWAPKADTVRSAAIDGREPSRERLAATGMDTSQFPLLGEYTPRVGRLPYDDLTVAWYPNLTWQIGARSETCRR